jgi:hypothetical protein
LIGRSSAPIALVPDRPFLVFVTIAVPLNNRGAVLKAPTGHTHALAAVHIHNYSRPAHLPTLVSVTNAIPLNHGLAGFHAPTADAHALAAESVDNFSRSPHVPSLVLVIRIARPLNYGGSIVSTASPSDQALATVLIDDLASLPSFL